MGFTLNEGGGYYGTSQPSDLGATQNPPYDQTAVPPGTYFVGHLTVSLAGLAPGVYFVQTDPSGVLLNRNRRSVVSSYFPGTPNPFRDEYIPSSAYAITVVPEPGTLALLSLGAIGLVAALRMKKV
jgi:hypothetical protein